MDSLSRELFSTYGIDIASMSLYIDLIWNHMLTLWIKPYSMLFEKLSDIWHVFRVILNWQINGKTANETLFYFVQYLFYAYCYNVYLYVRRPKYLYIQHKKNTFDAYTRKSWEILLVTPFFQFDISITVLCGSRTQTFTLFFIKHTIENSAYMYTSKM
jgi:hypothetical protein